jgi:hypothetical protein
MQRTPGFCRRLGFVSFSLLSAIDAGDAGDVCPHEPFPLWDGERNETPFGATRAPLDVVCGPGCKQSYTALAAALECEPLPDDAGPVRRQAGSAA